ncbi:MAG: hypothetical protein AAFR27_11830, partial [Pseudomonadota bacterium]
MDAQPNIAAEPKKVEKSSAGRDLGKAVAACFDIDTATPPFSKRLVELTSALTNSSAVSVWQKNEEQEWTMLARSQRAGPDPKLAKLIEDQLA